MKLTGTVYLVGAGPGDAGLLTLRGAELLRRADVVVYDALVNTELLRLAPKSAELIYGGKRPKEHALPQEELNALLVAKAREGKCVVRLKGGDPYIFGRGGEEAEGLAAEKVPFEVVPGISSVFAVPNYAGIPLTHRSHCSSFTVFTGHECPGRPGTTLDWAEIARTPGTKVVLMGAARIGEIAAQLIQHGLAAETPAAMVRWGTTGKQQTIAGTLVTIGDRAASAEFKSPALAIIGGVVTLRSKLNWFERRPLFGRQIVVTRTRDQASELSRRFFDLGADVLEIPSIKLQPPDNVGALVEAITGIGEYDWLVFTSPNGVTAFFDYFFKAYPDLRDLGAVRVAAVGPATAARLKELHLNVDVMPEEFVGRKVAAAIAKFESIENLRLLVVRAQVAGDDLLQQLEELGAIVDDIACYRTVPETDDVTGAASRLLESGADWLTFASSSAAHNFHARFDLPKMLERFPKMRVASIGPETSKSLSGLGLGEVVEATPHTIDGLVKAVLRSTAKQPA
jgi:uroporphyrinogen III methyltransferase/synthase